MLVLNSVILVFMSIELFVLACMLVGTSCMPILPSVISNVVPMGVILCIVGVPSVVPMVAFTVTFVVSFLLVVPLRCVCIHYIVVNLCIIGCKVGIRSDALLDTSVVPVVVSSLALVVS